MCEGSVRPESRQCKAPAPWNQFRRCPKAPAGREELDVVSAVGRAFTRTIGGYPNAERGKSALYGGSCGSMRKQIETWSSFIPRRCHDLLEVTTHVRLASMWTSCSSISTTARVPVRRSPREKTIHSTEYSSGSNELSTSTSTDIVSPGRSTILEACCGSNLAPPVLFLRASISDESKIVPSQSEIRVTVGAFIFESSLWSKNSLIAVTTSSDTDKTVRASLVEIDLP